MSTGKYFWFRVKEDFFNNDSILWLEDQEGGPEAFLLYMKLCCISLRNDGRICRKFGDRIVNHSEKSLAKVVMMDVNSVKHSLKLLREVDLISKGEDGIYFIPTLINMIGQEGAKAAVMRGRRKVDDGNKLVTDLEQIGNRTVTEMEQNSNKNSNKLLPNCSTKLELENIARDRDITIATVTGNNSSHDNVFKLWNENMFPPMREILKDELLDLIREYGEPKVVYAIREAAKHDKRNLAYVKGVCRGKKKSSVPFPDLNYVTGDDISAEH